MCFFFFSYADKNWSTPSSLRMKKLNLHSRIPSVRGLNAALPCQHTCNSSDCSTSWGRALITVGEWGVSHMLMSLSVNMLQHNNQWWDACLVIQGEKCSYKTKQRACFTFFPPGYAEQADKQADWINKQYRSKEGCCVCQCSVLLPEKTRQWVGKYFVSDLCTRDFLCTFKLNKIICEGAGKGACCYEVTNKIFTDCQLLRVYKATSSVALICGWVTFHHFNERFLAMPKIPAGEKQAGCICSPHVSDWKLQHWTAVYMWISQMHFCVSLKDGAVLWKPHFMNPYA